MAIVRLTKVATPSGLKMGYQDIVGEEFKLHGNAYFGFYIFDHDGMIRDILHYYYETVEK